MRKKLASLFQRKKRQENLPSADDLAISLNKFVKSIHKRVPTEVFTVVSSIRDSILKILPQIDDINSAEPYIFSIRRTVESYLPDAVQHYLKIPVSQAKYDVVSNGKTATDLLLDQLNVLDAEMKEIIQDLSQNNVQKMIIHGRFLDSKFGKSDWLRLDDK